MNKPYKTYRKDLGKCLIYDALMNFLAGEDFTIPEYLSRNMVTRMRQKSAALVMAAMMGYSEGYIPEDTYISIREFDAYIEDARANWKPMPVTMKTSYKR